MGAVLSGRRAGWIGGIALVIGLGATAGIDSAGPKFYDDDPIARVPEKQDASSAQEQEIDLIADLFVNLFSKPGDTALDVRALNVNTIDEVPDSSWFTNRIYARPLTVEELMRGPNTGDGPAGHLTVIRGKTAGAAPGFTVRDEKEQVWFLSFDPEGNPRAATAAVAVSCRLFWALGYHQIESHLTVVRRDALAMSESARFEPRPGYTRRMTMNDVERVLDRAAESPDGSYRAVAGRAVPGKPLGGFRYYGTRPDDPNDIVPHEHRRELRALKVFGAWTNLVDMKAGNTLDSLVTENGRGVIRHYLQDVGSTFGIGANGPHQWDEGHEYLYEGTHVWKRLLSFGFYLRPWQVVPFVEHPEIGRIEEEQGFNPEGWRTRVPNAAVVRARDDDTFWAALRVAAFSDEMIREVVKAGQFEDPAAATLLADILIKRRNRIAEVYLTKINPLVGFALSDGDGLTFRNAAVQGGVAKAPSGGYRADWFRFDNATSQPSPLGAPTTGSDERLRAPDLPQAQGSFVKVQVSASDPAHPSWSTPVDVYFRRVSGAWKLVGVERLPAGVGTKPGT